VEIMYSSPQTHLAIRPGEIVSALLNGQDHGQCPIASWTQRHPRDHENW
jgi:hypothetical protein